jgi:hypothetical protein
MSLFETKLEQILKVLYERIQNDSTKKRNTTPEGHNKVLSFSEKDGGFS